jgi:ADP-heptose:LPS heptosyltransferase
MPDSAGRVLQQMKKRLIQFNNWFYNILLPFFTLLNDRILQLFLRNGSEKNCILIVRLDAIGDFVMWSNAAALYREQYAERKIVLVANAAWHDLATRLPFWDEVIAVDIRKFAFNPVYRCKILLQVNRVQAALAIQPTLSRSFITGDAVILASKAPVRIGSLGDESNIHPYWKRISDKWYTTLIPVSETVISEFERSAEFVQQSGFKGYSAVLPHFPVMGSLAADLKPQEPYCIIFPGASSIGKQWPVEHFAALMNKISEKYKLQILLCGGAGEVELCETVLQASGNENCISLAGKTKLWELAELIRGSRFLISNDTSASHIAAAVDTPSVCILGGGHFGRFHPYPEYLEGNRPVAVFHMLPCFNCNWVCTQSTDLTRSWPCVSSVKVETVFQIIQTICRA